MGFRLRKSYRIVPGVRVNVGNKSLSASVGPRGRRTIVSTAGMRHSAGLSGTGLPYTRKFGKMGGGRIPSENARDGSGIFAGLITLGVVGMIVYMLVQAF